MYVPLDNRGIEVHLHLAHPTMAAVGDAARQDGYKVDAIVLAQLLRMERREYLPGS